MRFETKSECAARQKQLSRTKSGKLKKIYHIHYIYTIYYLGILKKAVECDSTRPNKIKLQNTF